MNSAKTISHLGDLTPDPQNARSHNAYNVGMIERALNDVGAARSIVIDEDGVVLAGNATIEAAAQAGIERVRVVEADGNELIAVQRRGLTPEQKARLAVYDNRTAEIATWDAGILAQLAATDPAIPDLWPADDWAALLAQQPSADEWADALGLPAGDRAPFQQMTFTVSDEQAEQIKRALEQAKRRAPFVETGNENSNGNALARICEVYLGRS